MADLVKFSEVTPIDRKSAMWFRAFLIVLGRAQLHHLWYQPVHYPIVCDGPAIRKKRPLALKGDVSSRQECLLLFSFGGIVMVLYACRARGHCQV